MKIKFYRFLARVFERILGFNSRFAYKFRQRVYDEIDYKHGPCDLAEKSAQRTGYWNLEAASHYLSFFFPYDKDKKQRNKLRPYVYAKFQVRKY